VYKRQLLYKAFSQAGRTYQIKYVNIKNQRVARQIEDELKDKRYSFEQILTDNYMLKEIPEREVMFSSAENPDILDSLYVNPVAKGQVIGPIIADSGRTVFIKVDGWKDTPVITQDAADKRYKMVNDLYKERLMKKNYEEYIRQVMKGKEIIFEEGVFYKLADALMPLYVKTEKQRDDIVKKGYWNKDGDEIDFSRIQPCLENMLEEKIFTVDGQSWTVSDMLNEIGSHPLVFRNNKIKNGEFTKELQLAVIDLVRDKYLTEEAYKSGIDKEAIPQEEYNVWKDNLNFLNAREAFLKREGADSLFTAQSFAVIDSSLNEYVNELQKKYASQIEINIKAFNEIEILRTDMAASYSGAPYVQVVPDFPLATDSYHLDYGKAVYNMK
jgi:hypothetical protein